MLDAAGSPSLLPTALGGGGISFCASPKVPLFTSPAQQELRKPELEYQGLSLTPRKMQGTPNPTETSFQRSSSAFRQLLYIGAGVGGGGWEKNIYTLGVGQIGSNGTGVSSVGPCPLPLRWVAACPAKFWSHSSCMRLLSLSRKGAFWVPGLWAETQENTADTLALANLKR